LQKKVFESVLKFQSESQAENTMIW